MAEQTFRSPGFFEREIDLSARETEPTGTPAGVIGASRIGPAFIPVTVGSDADFVARFGEMDPNLAGPYAVREYLKHKDAVTFMRVLGAGSNDTEAEISSTKTYGIVSKAGFKVSTANDAADRKVGMVTFISAKHYISASVEGVAFPQFTDNNSFPGLSDGDDKINILRAAIFPTTGSRIVLPDPTATLSEADIISGDSLVSLVDDPSSEMHLKFKVVVSSSAGTAFANDDSLPGCRIYTASLDPSSDDYISRVLNTDPSEFQSQQHLLYLDFAVENELAPVVTDEAAILLTSGSDNTNTVGGQSDKYRNSFGRFDTRYTTPRTPSVISQPFGGTEFDLFHFETISDGAAANNEFKVSIANVRASTDENNPYSTFEVQVRRFSDSDEAKEIIEAYPECTLDPTSDRFIARLIGDFKPRYNFDSLDVDEQRIVVTGRYPNRSRYVRVIVEQSVYDKEVPASATPFGFRGIPVIKATDTLTDQLGTALTDSDGNEVGSVNSGEVNARITGEVASSISGSILPPLPFRFKVTKGNVSTNTSPSFVGAPSRNERADSRLYWGVKFERTPLTASVANAALNPNAGYLPNPTVAAYTKMQGITGLDNLVTGSGADLFNDNKFTLARVALSTTALSNLTGSANQHMLEAAYLRDRNPDPKNYTVDDGTVSGRFTMATLFSTSSVKFNRFTSYNKFTLPFYGGFDGVNILDSDSRYLNDKAASTDPGGKAGDTFTGGLGLVGTNDGTMSGKGRQNNLIFSYRKAVDIMTDPLTVSHNLLAVPGIRDQFITDRAMAGVKAYSLAMYVMDIQHYDEDGNRLFDSDPARPDVRETVEQFEGRRVDSNYTATYFPDVFISDPANNRPVFVPSSVAAVGALSFSDSVSFPWFAPAGFSRGGLAFVNNTEVRLTSADRDDLYDARINPIANFPNGGFVIFGQKTLQINRSALDRVNVRRMLLEVKRLVSNVAEQLLFEPNNANTRARFVGQVAPVLSLIQAQSGIEKFSVIMDDTNNTDEDIEQNRLNGRIVVVPTRAIEFIAIDFIITNSGVEFA